RAHAARADPGAPTGRPGQGRGLGPGGNRGPRRSRSCRRAGGFRTARARLLDDWHSREDPEFGASTSGPLFTEPFSRAPAVTMLLSSIAELLARVVRHPAIEQTLAGLRRGLPEMFLAGLTDPAKALVVAQAAVEMRRPILFLVESGQRAEELAEPLRFFYRTLTGKSGTQVATLPALDVWPWQGLSPHPEILETRAVAL